MHCIPAETLSRVYQASAAGHGPVPGYTLTQIKGFRLNESDIPHACKQGVYKNTECGMNTAMAWCNFQWHTSSWVGSSSPMSSASVASDRTLYTAASEPCWCVVDRYGFTRATSSYEIPETDSSSTVACYLDMGWWSCVEDLSIGLASSILWNLLTCGDTNLPVFRLSV